MRLLPYGLIVAGSLLAQGTLGAEIASPFSAELQGLLIRTKEAGKGAGAGWNLLATMGQGERIRLCQEITSMNEDTFDAQAKSVGQITGLQAKQIRAYCQSAEFIKMQAEVGKITLPGTVPSAAVPSEPQVTRKLGERVSQFEVPPQAEEKLQAAVRIRVATKGAGTQQVEQAETKQGAHEAAAAERARAEEAARLEAAAAERARAEEAARLEAAAAERARAEEEARLQAAEQSIKQEERPQTEEAGAVRIRVAPEEETKQQMEQAAKAEEEERARVAALAFEQQIAAEQLRAQEMAQERLSKEMEAKLKAAQQSLKEAQELYDNLTVAVAIMRDDLRRVTAGRDLFDANTRDGDTPEAFMAALTGALQRGYNNVLGGNLEQVHAASSLLQQARTQLEAGQSALAEITHDRMELNSQQ